MPYRVKHRIRKGGGEFWNPGDILSDAEVPKPQTLLKLGWIEKAEGGRAAAKAPEPTPEPAADPLEPEPAEDKPAKKKRGRPKKKAE